MTPELVVVYIPPRPVEIEEPRPNRRVSLGFLIHCAALASWGFYDLLSRPDTEVRS